MSWCCMSLGWLWPVYIPYKTVLPAPVPPLTPTWLQPFPTLPWHNSVVDFCLEFLSCCIPEPATCCAFWNWPEYKLNIAMLNSTVHLFIPSFPCDFPHRHSPLSAFSSSLMTWGAVIFSQCQISCLVIYVCILTVKNPADKNGSAVALTGVKIVQICRLAAAWK